MHVGKCGRLSVYHLRAYRGACSLGGEGRLGTVPNHPPAALSRNPARYRARGGCRVEWKLWCAGGFSVNKFAAVVEGEMVC